MRLIIGHNQMRNSTARGVLQKFPGMSSYNRNLKEILDPKLQKDLTVLEDQEGCVYSKFGVIFAKSGQSSDTEMLGNERGNAAFENFLKVLGQRIELSGFGGYKGGLDVSTNMTGSESVYTAFCGQEIMFHVSTLLPYSERNTQQIERKRHIGNDIVNIVFEADGYPSQPSFTPTMMKSHFTHIFAVVKFDIREGCYRLWVYSEESVPPYGPALPNPCTFHDPLIFREFLLTKLINAEKAAFQAKAFVAKRQRTNDTLLKDMYLDYLKNYQKAAGMRIQKMTDSFRRHLGSPIKRESSDDKQTFDFTRLGELVKLEKMLCGDVTTNGASPGSRTRGHVHPWQPQVVATDMVSWDVVSSDSLAPSSLLLVTSDQGVIYVCAGLSAPLIEEAAKVQQLFVLEHFGIILLRCDKGKDGYVSVFPIGNLRREVQSGSIVHKRDCLEGRVAETKGCTLCATSEPNGLRLSVVAAIGRRLTLFRWAFGSTGSRINGVANVPQRFSELKHVTVVEELLMLRAFETNCKSVGAVFTTKSGIFRVDFASEIITHISLPSISKKNLVKIDVKADTDGEELLLAFDNVIYVMDISRSEQELVLQDIYWSSNIDDFVYRFPFVIGFTEDTIEVRLAVNGNVLASVYAPGVKLLSCKDDVFFVTERSSSTTAGAITATRSSADDAQSPNIGRSPVGSLKSPRIKRVSSKQKLTLISGASGGVSGRSTPRRWDLHMIPGRRLNAFDSVTKAHNNPGIYTPNVNRRVTPVNSNNATSNVGITIAGQDPMNTQFCVPSRSALRSEGTPSEHYDMLTPPSPHTPEEVFADGDTLL